MDGPERPPHRLTTLLVGEAELTLSALVIAGPPYRHLFRARRLAKGARLRLVDGRGRARWGRVESVGPRRASVCLEGEAPSNERPRRLEVLVATPRRERAAWLVEKTTELGVAAVRFFRCGRAPRSYGEATLRRLERVAAAALEQCHRARLPEVSGVHSWPEALDRLRTAPRGWYLEPGGGPAPAEAQDGTLLLVGPEGGWTVPERAELRRLGATSLGLGPTILRVETAAVVGAGLLLAGGGSADLVRKASANGGDDD